MILERLIGFGGGSRIGAATKLGPVHPRDPAAAELWGGAEPVAAGETVNETSALSVSTCFCAINLISGTLGALPLLLYERLSPSADFSSKRRASDHPLYTILHDAPNPEMTATTFITTLAGHMVSWGNGYAEIERSRGGRPVALWPITPNRVTPARTRDDKRLVYDVTNSGGPNTTFEPAELLHVRGLGFDGVRGYSVIGLARQTLGLAMAAEKFGGAFFGNGSVVSGFLKHPGELTEEASKRLLARFAARHGGATRAHKLGILEEGMEFASATMPLEDAQFLETRKFTVVEIARWFNLPPSKLKDMADSKYATVEYHSIEFMTDTLLPWERRLAQELDRKLLTESERGRFYFAMLFDAILRADIKTRYEAHRTSIDAGFASRDEVRAMEDRNPIPDGKGAIFTTAAAAHPVGETPTAQSAFRSPQPNETEPAEEAAIRSRSSELAIVPVLADSILRMTAVAQMAIGRMVKRGASAEVRGEYLTQEFQPKLVLSLGPGFEALAGLCGLGAEEAHNGARSLAAAVVERLLSSGADERSVDAAVIAEEAVRAFYGGGL